MAGGEGTRLRPLTSNAPKPMMPIANRPMMEHIVDLLKQHGFDDIVVTVAFMANHIRNYFGDGSELGVRMVYATEESPLGTAGSVRNARDELDERFLVISGDVLTDIDLGAIVRFHEERGAMATIGLVPVEDPLEFGIVITRDDGSIERFLEKPTWGQVFSDTINTGIFVLEPEIFDYIAPDRSVDFCSEVFPKLLEDGKPLFGAVVEGYWEDVGTLDAYVRAHKDVLDGRVSLDLPGFEISDGVYVGEGAEIHPDARIDGPAIVGDYCRIEAGARLGEYSVLGINVRVRKGADLQRSVIHDNTYIGENVRMRGTTVGRACDLRNGVRSEEGVVLGDECFVGEQAVLGSGVKVYPFKTVETGAIINSSIVWESRGSRSLFGRLGVAGLANVDVTPEMATRVAMAFGTTLKKDATVITSRDSSRSARMLKRAMMAGLNAAGINVRDLEVASMPVTRFAVGRPDADAGISIRLDEDDPQSVVIRFFDSKGADITESGQRKIERLFLREDFRRVFPGEIGDIGFPPRHLEHYSTALEAAVDVAKHRGVGLQGRRRLRVRRRVVRHAQRAVQARRRRAGGEPVHLDRRDHVAGTATSTRPTWAGWCGPRVRPWARVIDPGGENLTLVDDTGHVLSDDEALLAFVALVSADLDEGSIALPLSVTSHADGPGRPQRHRHRAHQAVERRPHAGGERAGRALRRRRQRRLHPPRLPARLRRRRRHGQDARAAGHRGHVAVEGGGHAARRPHPARGGRHPLGAEGHGHAVAGRAVEGPRGRPHRRGEGAPRRRLGAGAARPRGAGDPRVGRGGHRSPTPAGSRRSMHGAYASSYAEQVEGHRMAEPQPPVEV